MSKLLAVAAVAALAGTASAVPIVNNPQASFASLEASLGVSLTPINLFSQPITVSGGGNSLNAPKNVLVSDFFVLLPNTSLAYSGRLTSEVFGNQSSTGPGLTDVVIKYSFEQTAGPNSIETFNFGVNSGQTIDLADLLAATHGDIVGENISQAFDPAVSADTLLGNNTFDFDFRVNGAANELQAGDRYVWYVAGAGDVKVNVVDVTVTDFGNATAKALTFTTTNGQNDLNVPAPGASALALLGLGVAASRRRR
jgi:hypothetical protein